MKSMKNRQIERVLLGVVCLALLVYLGVQIPIKGRQPQSVDAPRIAVIKQNAQVIERIDLAAVTETREIELPGAYREIIIVEKGRIRFKEANCPDQICVKAGWLEDPGDMAVCIPNRAIVVIEELNVEDLDVEK